MRVLITGITGMAGSHLARYLVSNPNTDVFGIHRPRSNRSLLADIEDNVTLIEANILDPVSMNRALAIAEPHVIFHLAAQSYVPASWTAPSHTIQTNVIGQVNLFEAVLANKLHPVIHIAGSSEEYGMVNPEDLPIKESYPLRPLSPYGVSKVAQEMLAFQYHRSYGLKTIVTRAFNHEGPGRGDVFVTSSFAKQIAEIEKGTREPFLLVGDLTAKRDWTDVRDMVRAYWDASQWCDFGEVYNIGSGVSRTVEQMLDLIVNCSNATFGVAQDPSRMRPSDIPELRCDSTKFLKATGWKPEIPFETTMLDLLTYWRERV